MFKTFIRCLSVLFCGMVGFALFTCIYTQPAALASPYNVHDDPTPTPTATYNPSLTLALPTGGTPSGRPGTVIQLTGTGFPPNGDVTFSIATDPNQCASGNGGVTALQPQQPAKADGNGGFMVQASWPDGANQPNTKYYVCANVASANVNAAATTPFTVLGQPTVSTSNQTVNAGDQVTITGQNWLPQQGLNVSITAGQGGNAIANGQATPDANGTFTLNLTIPAGTPAGNYGINVVGQNDPNLKTYQDNAITVNAQATPTPQATATPTPQPTPQPTPTPTPTPPNNGGSSGGGGLTWLIFVLGGIGVVLVIIGLTMYLSNTHSS